MGQIGGVKGFLEEAVTGTETGPEEVQEAE